MTMKHSLKWFFTNEFIKSIFLRKVNKILRRGSNLWFITLFSRFLNLFLYPEPRPVIGVEIWIVFPQDGTNCSSEHSGTMPLMNLLSSDCVTFSVDASIIAKKSRFVCTLLKNFGISINTFFSAIYRVVQKKWTNFQMTIYFDLSKLQRWKKTKLKIFQWSKFRGLGIF